MNYKTLIWSSSKVSVMLNSKFRESCFSRKYFAVFKKRNLATLMTLTRTLISIADHVFLLFVGHSGLSA